ncbi:MAG: hypothetical protein ACKVP1_13250 [Burkholderiaceae bacterium]
MPKAYWISAYQPIRDADALAAYAKLAGPSLTPMTMAFATSACVVMAIMLLHSVANRPTGQQADVDWSGVESPPGQEVEQRLHARNIRGRAAHHDGPRFGFCSLGTAATGAPRKVSSECCGVTRQ